MSLIRPRNQYARQKNKNRKQKRNVLHGLVFVWEFGSNATKKQNKNIIHTTQRNTPTVVLLLSASPIENRRIKNDVRKITIKEGTSSSTTDFQAETVVFNRFYPIKYVEYFSRIQTQT